MKTRTYDHSNDGRLSPLNSPERDLFEKVLSKMLKQFKGVTFAQDVGDGMIRAVASDGRSVFYGSGTTVVEALSRTLCDCYLNGGPA
jgi:hypothetical protein